MFDHELHHATQISQRFLELNMVKKVKKYTDIVELHSKYHKLQTRFEECNTILTNDPTNSSGRIEYDSLQKQLERGQRSAERRCGRKDMGYPWSPRLMEAVRAVLVWKAAKWDKIKVSKITKRTRAEASKINITMEKRMSYQKIIKQLKLAWASLKKVQENSKSVR